MNKLFSYLFLICCISVLFSCQKEFSTEHNIVLPAEGSLWDSAGNCLPSSVHGSFYNGITPNQDTAYVEIQVNVTQTGSYNITSDLQDGFQFFDSGFFSNTGLNIIRLKPIGTPIIPAPATFNISFDSSFCSFTVNIQDSTGTGMGGQDSTGNGDPDAGSALWQFTQGSFTYNGSIDSAAKDNSTGLATLLTLAGASVTGDTALYLQFAIPAADIQPGTYTTTNSGLIFSVVKASTFTILFAADSFTPGTDMTIDIVSYNSTSKVVQGIFSGNAKDSAGNIVPITTGSFTATVP